MTIRKARPDATPLPRLQDIVCPGIDTRVYHGDCGRIVVTVEAANSAEAGLLGRVCGSAVEAAMFKVFRDRLTRY